MWLLLERDRASAFLVLLIAMSAEVNMCLYFIHSTVRSGSLAVAVAPLYQQFKLNMALYSSWGTRTQHLLPAVLWEGQMGREKKCGYGISLASARVAGALLPSSSATYRIFN